MNTARIFKRLKLAKVDGTYLKELGKLLRADLLVLDDFGLQAFDNYARESLMDSKGLPLLKASKTGKPSVNLSFPSMYSFKRVCISINYLSVILKRKNQFNFHDEIHIHYRPWTQWQYRD